MSDNGIRVDEVNENITIRQRVSGLTFGTDAYLLYAYIKRKKNAVAAELGAGTGIISLLALSKGKAEKIYAFEVQKTFADLVSENAALNGMSDRLFPICADVRNASAKDIGAGCDYVFSNPPYMRADCGFHNDNDEMNIARREVLGTINDFCLAAKRLLKFGGSFYTVYRPDRLSDLISAMRNASIEPKRLTLVCADEKAAPTLVLCEGRYGGAPGLFVTRPLIMHTDASAKKLENSRELDYIYEKGEFDDSFGQP